MDAGRKGRGKACGVGGGAGGAGLRSRRQRRRWRHLGTEHVVRHDAVAGPRAEGVDLRQREAGRDPGRGDRQEALRRRGSGRRPAGGRQPRAAAVQERRHDGRRQARGSGGSADRVRPGVTGRTARRSGHRRGPRRRRRRRHPSRGGARRQGRPHLVLRPASGWSAGRRGHRCGRAGRRRVGPGRRRRPAGPHAESGSRRRRLARPAAGRRRRGRARRAHRLRRAGPGHRLGRAAAGREGAAACCAPVAAPALRPPLRVDGRHPARRQGACLQPQDARADPQLRRVRRGCHALRLGDGAGDLVAAVTRIAADRRLPDGPPRHRPRIQAGPRGAVRRRRAEARRLQDGHVLVERVHLVQVGFRPRLGRRQATSSASRCPTAPTTSGRRPRPGSRRFCPSASSSTWRPSSPTSPTRRRKSSWSSTGTNPTRGPSSRCSRACNWAPSRAAS